MAKFKKTSRHDRYDRIYLKGLDSMHVLIPFLMPKRCDNEALLDVTVDIAAINEYLAAKNAGSPAFKYTWFHVISAALAKTICLRPKMNWFISGDRLYERRNVEIAFNVKRQFTDHGEEAIAKFVLDRDGGSPVEQFHDYVEKFVNMVRKENKNEDTTDAMNVLCKLPRFMLKFVFWFLGRLEYHGLYPESLAKMDPCYSSVYVSNLGSIKMNADYHHIYERGTISFFCVIGEKKFRPEFKADGTYEMRETIPLGLTIDERIADGYYFARSIRLFQHLLQHPELLDRPVSEPVEFE